MLRFEDYYESDKDTCATHRDPCDIFEEQRAYVIALGLTKACVQIGK